MHEVSLVRDLLKQAEQAMLQNHLSSLTAIHVEIGPLSGVDPLLVEQAFQSLIHETIFTNTRLVVEQPKLMAVCRECARGFEIMDFQFRCPDCKSNKVQVTSGDQLRLVSISTAIDNDLVDSFGSAHV